jgi:hypothetical protein
MTLEHLILAIKDFIRTRKKESFYLFLGQLHLLGSYEQGKSFFFCICFIFLKITSISTVVEVCIHFRACSFYSQSMYIG